MHVFGILDTLKVTAEGYDRIPAWFLQLLAPICSRSLAHLINTSIYASHVPEQWKTAIISPVPKVADPKAPADYRPISVIPILSRLTGRIIVHQFIYPRSTNHRSQAVSMTSSHPDPRDQPLLPSSNCCNKLPPYWSSMTMFCWRQLTFQKLSTQFAMILCYKRSAVCIFLIRSTTGS